MRVKRINTQDIGVTIRKLSSFISFTLGHYPGFTFGTETLCVITTEPPVGRSSKNIFTCAIKQQHVYVKEKKKSDGSIRQT